jgi:hypothetical protein
MSTSPPEIKRMIESWFLSKRCQRTEGPILNQEWIGVSVRQCTPLHSGGGSQLVPQELQVWRGIASSGGFLERKGFN